MLTPHSLLTTLGLTEKEAKIYLALLQLDTAGPSDIARASGINRSTTYVLLESLLEKGFVTTVVGNKKTFHAEDPEKLLLLQRNKTAEFERSLPRLKEVMKKHSEQPRVRFFLGLDGVKQAYEESLLMPKGSMIRAFGSARVVEDKLKGYIEEYVRKRAAKKITCRAVIIKDSWAESVISRDKKDLRESHLLESTQFDQDIEIDIYGDKITAVSLKEGELFAVILESKTFAKTFAQMFDIIWESAQIPAK